VTTRRKAFAAASGVIPANAGIQMVTLDSRVRGNDAGADRARAAIALVTGLFKLRIGLVIGFTALAGLAVTPGPALEGWRIAALGLAVILSAAAAGGFNQWYERDLDAQMRRTRGRPFVTGELARDGRWLWLLAAIVVGSTALAALATNWLAALHTFLGAFVYAVVYTVWLKRRTWWNIVIGGLAGSFAVLAGAAAVAPGVPPAVPAVLAVVLFLWTPPHFWSLAIACREDYAAARVPMLPVVVGDARCARAILAHTAALVALSFVPLALGMGWIYGAGATLGGGLFAYASVRLAANPTRKTALANFFASLAQLTVLLTAAIVDSALAG
jgi:protoheme IX farnesyltransferase